ncbi:transglutaminase domain-containing protein [Amycolatopsis sp. K13G38]|uniref:Transglutaminase domain-containing protein n=1 Tax=Amycolatopsis acididurans TaxID=2724524 RepID=A0ABX1JIT4_9PSEU|nr:transglutaminase-like domain-containing protein [Amycolatopsis acididurans]NKQ58749.1 transglutaminase domain-containing protein [Amycolatopsis acididurans]
MTERHDDFTQPTHFLDWRDPAVLAFTDAAVRGTAHPVDRARLIFLAVRDQLWYDPYTLSTHPADYRASSIARRDYGWCVPKAVLLTAACRAAGIPARLGFADVRNHLQTDTLRARMGGSDLFVYHGYSELYLDGRWVKATPAFNKELCARFGVPPIDFDGVHDALMHPYSADGSRFMDYVTDHGWYPELPLAEIFAALRAEYGSDLIDSNDIAAHTPEDTFTR